MMARTRSVQSGFEQRIRANLRACDITGQRVVVAFSGGPDSLALAIALRRVSKPLGLEPVLAHVDHRLRLTSEDDARQCRSLAQALDFPFEMVALRSDLSSRARGLGIEEQGRRERYVALANVAQAWHSDVVITGHQANDQAETVLLHLFRGAGLRGLCGMQLQETRQIPWWAPALEPVIPVRLIRPMLREPRTVIEQYLHEHEFVPLLDESNRTDDFDRNFIRNQLLPQIQKHWPAVIETLARSTESIRLDDDFLTELADRMKPETLDDDRALDTRALLDCDPAIAMRVARNWLTHIGVEEVDIDVVARIYDLAVSGDKQRMVEVGSNRTVVVDNDGTLTTLDRLLHRASEVFPVDAGEIGQRWSISIEDPISFPVDGSIEIRKLRAGDHWFGSRERVVEELRIAGIHPLVRPYLLAVASGSGILVIPAIYPVIRAKTDHVNTIRTRVRWQKQQT